MFHDSSTSRCRPRLAKQTVRRAYFTGRRICGVVGFAVLLAAAAPSANAARRAQEGEHKFVVRGTTARQLIDRLRLSDELPVAEFPVRGGWSCTAGVTGPESCADRPPGLATVRLLSQSEPEVVLEGVFADALTGSMKKVPQYTACSSPATVELLRRSTWKHFLDSSAPTSEGVLFSSGADSSPLIEVSAWSAPSYEADAATQQKLVVCLGIDESAPAVRRQRTADYDRCTRHMRDGGLDGGC